MNIQIDLFVTQSEWFGVFSSIVHLPDNGMEQQ